MIEGIIIGVITGGALAFVLFFWWLDRNNPFKGL